MKSDTFPNALSMQLRVLWALCLREIHGKHGKSKLGYFWVLFKTAFGIGVFYVIRTLGGLNTPHGMPVILFLLLGFIPWYIFSGVLRMSMEAVKTNRALLTFPQIFPLDLYISSGIVVWATEVVILLLFFLGLTLTGVKFTLHDPITLFSMLVLVGFFGLGLGIVLSIITLYVPVVDKIVPMVLRILFFTSGVFFSPSQIAARFSSIIYWNPLINFIEACRGAFVVRVPPAEIKMGYIISTTFFFLALGLLLERYARSRQTE